MFQGPHPIVQGQQQAFGRQVSSAHVHEFDGSGGIRPATVPVSMAKNTLDRFFHAQQEPQNRWHELFFGSPQQSVDSRMTTPWQTRGEWPVDYLGRNLTRSSNVIWYMAEIQNMNAWVNNIAPMLFTNMLSFTVQQKIFSDDGADFIGLSAVPSEVSSYIMEKTRSGTYIGKGTTMHANMLSSPEGVRELWEKFMQIAVAIAKTELFDFIDQVRRAKYADIETAKMRLVQRPSEYFDKEKYNWDIARKVKNGMQALTSEVARLVATYRGQVDSILVPQKLLSILPFKPEYSDYYVTGNKTTTFRNKIDARKVPDRSATGDLNKGGYLQDLCGLRVHVIRPLLSTTMDLYQHVLASYRQIGTLGHVYNKKDEEMQDPMGFVASDLQVQMYDEEQDSWRIVQFEQCLDNDPVFESAVDETGGVRDLTQSNLGNPADQFHDPFVVVSKTAQRQRNMPMQPAGVAETYGMGVRGQIRLVGQMNIAHPGHAKRWPGLMRYCGETLLNHFGRPRKFVSRGDLQQFSMLFDHLENIPFDPKVLERFVEANWRVQRNLGRGAERPQETVYATDDFYELEQNPNTGFYNFARAPGELGRAGPIEIPFGCANLWGVNAISKLDTQQVRPGIDRDLVTWSRKFMYAWRMHRDHLLHAFPECQFLKHAARFSPAVFQHPRAGVNLYLNTMHNASNFLWVNYKPYQDTTVGMMNRNADDPRYSPFLRSLATDARGPRWQESGRYTRGRAVTDVVATVSVALGKIALAQDAADDSIDDRSFLGLLRDNGLILSNDVGGMDADAQLGEFAAAFAAYENQANVFTTRGLFYKAFAEDGDLRRPRRENMTLEEYDRHLRSENGGVLPDGYNEFRQNAEQLRNAFLIYANARMTAERMSDASEQRAVRTVLTLSPSLKRSIAYSQGYGSVFQTVLTRTGPGQMSEVPAGITSGDNVLPGTSCESIARLDKPFVPYHVWYANELARPENEMDVAMFLQGVSLARENITGQFAETFKDALAPIKGDPFHRSATATLLLSDMNSRNMRGMIHCGACPPIEYLVFRPHMEYRTFPAIFIQSGGAAAFRIRGNPLFMMGLAATRGVLYYRYAQSMGTIIVAEENIFVQENVLVDSYIGGANTKFYSPSEMFDYLEDGGGKYYDPHEARFGIEGDCSMFAISAPIGYSRAAPMDIDITGHYHELVQKGWDYNMIFGSAPLYPTAFRFQNFWRLSLEQRVETDNTFSPPNTRCSRDRALYKVDGKWDVEMPASSHWGNECTQPGLKAFRAGSGAAPVKNYLL